MSHTSAPTKGSNAPHSTFQDCKLTVYPDCRSCRLRRIRCDRSLPGCAKCRRKGIPCPGYNPHLRWTNSIASRGRFRGLTAPEPSSLTGPVTGARPQDYSSLDSSNFSKRIKSHHTVTEGSKLEDADFESIPETSLDELIQYYTAEIAPFNVWVNSHYNGYSRFVLPLAKTHLVLKLAITGIAAAHQPQKTITTPGFAQWSCQKALVLITDRVRKLADMNMDQTPTQIEGDIDSSESVLAATLVLSNYSLLQSDISLALFHLQAARVLIRTLSARRVSNDELFSFLKNQVAGLDVVACTTLFDADYIKDAVLSDSDRGVFGHFLCIIHNITVCSISQDTAKREFDFIALDLEDELEIARGASLMEAGRLLVNSNHSYRRDVTRLVQAFHHAGLLYACKRARITNAKEVEAQHVYRLFRLLEQFEDINACMGNLSWPLFIGGICICQDDLRQQIVRRICLRLSTNSPFKYYANILTFLEELWASEHWDWIVIAREWEGKSMPILAV